MSAFTETKNTAFEIVLMFYGENAFCDTETGELKTSSNALRLSPYKGKQLASLFPYFTKALKGETFKERVPRKLMIYENGKEIYRLPAGQSSITDKQGNVKKRLQALNQWLEDTQYYIRSGGHFKKTSFNSESKTTQKRQVVQMPTQTTYQTQTVPDVQPLQLPKPAVKPLVSRTIQSLRAEVLQWLQTKHYQSYLTAMPQDKNNMIFEELQKAENQQQLDVYMEKFGQLIFNKQL